VEGVEARGISNAGKSKFNFVSAIAGEK
jgi:hypothetical protein